MQIKFPKRDDLGLQILALYLLFVTPVVIASLLFDYVASGRMKAEAKASDLALARAIAEETSSTLQNALLAVQYLAEYPVVQQSDLAGMKELFEIALATRPDLNLIYRLDADGIMKFHYPESPGTTIGVDFSFREYFVEAQKTRTPLLSKGRISPTTNQPVATAVKPLWNPDNQFIGLVATNIKLESLSMALNNIVQEYSPTQQFEVMILDSAGQVIAHADKKKLLNDLNSQLPEIATAALDGNSGTLELQNPTGIETLYSYMPVSSLNWVVIVSRPTAAAYATPNTLHRAILLAIAIFLLIGLIFWLALYNRVIDPLERLAALSQTIGLQEIHPDQRVIFRKLSKRPDQMGKLINNLTRMEAAIQDRLNELSTLLDTSAAVVSSLDTDIVLNRILEQVERLLNIEKSLIVAFDNTRGMFRARAYRGISKRYADHLLINPAESDSVSMRALRAHEPVQISDTETDPTFCTLRPRARSEGYRAVLAVPLNTTHAPPSALLVYHELPHHFTKGEIDLITSFANHAAMAIENATLFKRSDTRLQEQTRRLEALVQSQIDGLILEDLDGNVQYANRRMGEIVGLDSGEIQKSTVDELLQQIDLHQEHAVIQTRLKEALQSQTNQAVDVTITHKTRIKKERHFRIHIFPVTDSKNIPIGRGQIWHDMTADKELDAMKSSLIATVSHELRTPLAAIKGYASTLLAKDVEWDTPSRDEFLGIISSETDRLSELVKDLLDLSQIEAGNLAVSRSEVDLNELVTRAASRSRPNPGSRLRIEIPDDLPFISIDPKRIEVVFRNLIENAAKYSPPDSQILVKIEAEPDQIIVQVLDEGPGIPPEYQELVFQSFYRVENGLTRSTPGAGLGLAISRGFIQAHGGNIWLEPCDIGTRITFSLPLQTFELEKSDYVVGYNQGLD